MKVVDDLTDTVVSHYVGGLERRYTKHDQGSPPYHGLLEFMKPASNQGAQIEMSRIIGLVTGPSAVIQRPGHGYYRGLVNAFPGSAGDLLHKVERIDSRDHGGLKLNILTGTLLAIRDVEDVENESALQADVLGELRNTVAATLAGLLHRNNLRSFDQWSIKGSTEPVSATVAWLIRVVGWLADTDDHLACRMIQNLAAAIESIPAADRSWGADAQDVRQGFEWIKQKQPTLWEKYGAHMESAATSIGPWKVDEHDNL